MARSTTTVTRRSTTSVHARGADEMKQNLTRIASEIAKVRDQAQQEAHSLDKIRGMLDMGYLNDLLHNVEELEVRIQGLENDTLQSQTESIRLQSDLEAEQERLAKLWDAYKIQEDELTRVKRDYPLLEEKLFERERSIEGLRREVSRLEPFQRYKDDYEVAVAENRHLAGQLDGSERELATAHQRLESLQGDVEALRAMEGDARRVKDLEKRLEEEQERLAKLYKVYEDEQADRAEIENRLADWENWFRKVRPAFEATGTAPGSAPS